MHVISVAPHLKSLLSLTILLQVCLSGINICISILSFFLTYVSHWNLIYFCRWQRLSLLFSVFKSLPLLIFIHTYFKYVYSAVVEII